MTFNLPFLIVLAVATALWLCLIAACVFVFCWSCTSAGRYFWRATIVAILAVAISYWAITHVRVTWSGTLDGRPWWRIDSRWFFMLSLGLAISALVFTLFRRWRLPNVD